MKEPPEDNRYCLLRVISGAVPGFFVSVLMPGSQQRGCLLPAGSFTGNHPVRRNTFTTVSQVNYYVTVHIGIG
jgi:hypothetical protein